MIFFVLQKHKIMFKRIISTLPPIFLFIILFASCNKEEPLTPLAQNKIYLTGVGATPTKWYLTSYVSTATVLPLNYAQKRYYKTFGANNFYKDSDGFVGSWDMPGMEQLIERYVNYPSGAAASQSYQIVSITATNLIILHDYNGTPITAVYTAGN
jgi:hypothetical protein